MTDPTSEEVTMEEIKAFIIFKLNKRYGYVGCAEAPGKDLIRHGDFR